MKKGIANVLLVICVTQITWSYGQVVNLSGRWKFNIGDNQSWSSTIINDQDWSSIRVPGKWEDQGYNGYDGFAWYRTWFDASNLKANTQYYLNLGFIDDVDEVYINGQLIGFSGGFPPQYHTAFQAERKYIIPGNIINYNGTNSIAVRVFDATLEGGIIDGRIGIFRYVSSPMLIDLKGIWEFTTVDDDKPVTNERWERIMTPSPWEKQGYRRHDGFAWYKKTFDYSDNLAGEDLVIIAGKIDDFDEVYINSRLVGRTNDRRGYGHSTSYKETRVYNIPANLLNKNKPNVIEIKVEDIGGDGGIYDGPIGITTRSLYNDYFRNR